MKQRPFTLISIFISLLIYSSTLNSSGKVYLVIGSDTAIWDGMNVARYHCFYRISLYIDPLGNAYKVMDPSFRDEIRDSYGSTIKLTWWMMAGNIFRFAENKNMPLANTMTLYLMKKYHGDAIKQFGDELSLHYHTFHWFDYSGDGKYYWNQALNFNDCLDDFNLTVAQFLLEENVYPISFRSGWHYMDNDWQKRLDQLLPYSLHNDWPAKRTDTVEPLDNTFDWSLAPSDFVPFRPSPENYQLPGNGKGWNVRSKFMGNVSQAMMDDIFKKANEGIDQVACFWAHLPESDFLDNIRKINNLAHNSAAKYPGVKFQYNTAVEAMQLWRQSTDFTPPQLSIQEQQMGSEIYFVISTDEPIFQDVPFLAVKDVYERYHIIESQSTGTHTWRTINNFDKNILAKVGVAVTDTFGNLSTRFINYLPDDIYIDNLDEGYSELEGSWFTSSETAWGINSRKSMLTESSTARVRWNPIIEQTGLYNIFIQFPQYDNPSNEIDFIIYSGYNAIDTIKLNQPVPQMDWVYITTANFAAGNGNYVEMSAGGNNQSGKYITADVMKFSALVRDKELYTLQKYIDFGETAEEDTVIKNLEIINRGINQLTISGITSKENSITTTVSFPLIIEGMSKINLPLAFHSAKAGKINDTLFILSDDYLMPEYPILYSANVQLYFKIVDNDDSLDYKEFGNWQTSVAQAYGQSSRYVFINANPGAWASFTAMLDKPGIYSLNHILPKTVNSANNALYEIILAGFVIDSIYADQNEGSGDWVELSRYYLPAGAPIEVKIINSGESTAGDVLRADAIKLALLQEITDIADKNESGLPSKFELRQNYPNPFNPATIISYELPENGFVTLKIYDILGREISTLVNEYQPAGKYKTVFSIESIGNASNLSSGTYIYTLSFNGKIYSRKMQVVK